MTRKLADLIVTTLILNEDVDTREKAIDAILERLGRQHIPVEIIPELREGILKREQLGSTAIGRGVAIPHTKHRAATSMMGALALSSRGLDFDSIDGEPVHLIFLLIGAIEKPGATMRVTPESELLIRQLRSDEFCRRLREADSEETLARLLNGPEPSDD